MTREVGIALERKDERSEASFDVVMCSVGGTMQETEAEGVTSNNVDKIEQVTA